MSLPVRLLPDAQREFDDAADWYERQKAGLGADFVAAVRAAIQGIAATPAMYAIVSKDVRKGG